MFDSLNAHKFGSPETSTLSDAAFRCTARTRASYILWRPREVFIRDGGWPELNREFMLSPVN